VKRAPTIAAGVPAVRAEGFTPPATDRPSVCVDLCVFTIDGPDLTVLLIRRLEPPFAGDWALPGGFVRAHESLEEAARRKLAEETGIEDIYLEQLYTFGAPDRDPRMRVITVAYYALVPRERLTIRPGPGAAEAAWFRVVDDRRARVRVAALADDAVPDLAFDHADIVETAVRRIRGKLEYTTIAFELLPREFTLTELQRVYETILRRRLAKAAFRRKVLAASVLREAKGTRRGGHRPAQLYRFAGRDRRG
jgi:8-oxo-dGTP diphosphatase